MEPGELVVFSEQMRLPEDRVPFPDILLALEEPSPKLRVFGKASNGVSEVDGYDNMIKVENVVDFVSY